MRRWRFVIAFTVIAAAMGYLVLNGFDRSMVYYLTVNELLVRGASAGENVRVAGVVVAGSIEKDPRALSLRFLVEDKTGGGRTIPVSYAGLVPDTFQEKSDVVVEGTLGSDGVFHAQTLMAKCPSKYEGQYENLEKKGSVRAATSQAG
jgi:cytochrome c-type biogenesis protein CcmE